MVRIERAKSHQTSRAVNNPLRTIKHLNIHHAMKEAVQTHTNKDRLRQIEVELTNSECKPEMVKRLNKEILIDNQEIEIGSTPAAATKSTPRVISRLPIKTLMLITKIPGRMFSSTIRIHMLT